MEPKPRVKLVGHNGNAFLIISKCSDALKRAKCSKSYIDKFQEQAMSGDYDNVLRTAMEYCEVS